MSSCNPKREIFLAACGCHDSVSRSTVDAGGRGGLVIELDLGDVTLSVNVRVKGLPRYALVWHIGPPSETTPADRVVKPPPYHEPTGRTDLIMDLRADMQVPLSVQFTDELGNPVPTPANTTFVFTVDDPTIINLTDNGDGTAVAAAVGVLGTANVHLVATWDGRTLTGDLQIVVVAGLAERINIVAGTPTEVTPDTDAPTGLTATPGDASAALTWTAPAGVAVSSYTVKRGDAQAGPFTAVLTGVATTTATDVGLTNGTEYWYVVSALKVDGTETANSTAVSVTPTA